MNPYIQIAKDALITNLKHNKDEYLYPDYIDPEMITLKAGVFVSLFDSSGKPRGSIGTTGPTQPNLILEIAANTVCAATKDPRFPPVVPEEIDQLKIQIDVLSELEPIDSITVLDPAKYGLLLKKGDKKAIILPDSPGLKTIEDQVNAVLNKAGITNGIYDCQLFRFTTKRYT